MREPDFLMAETIEKSSCIKGGHCRHLRTNPGNQSFARNHVLALGGESRQKMGEVLDFCLPDPPKSRHADPKVEQNPEKSEKYSTRLSSLKHRNLSGQN